ncbi:SPOR domain-containing protein [Erythrobacter sp. HKB08]|uniref:SPOR domain-containing protein n=1 Tax=Erythrobacter sp. HKB08 TaxID=2502843 RepID=UPI001F271339|nr:SPOR domain-containing protein [Erythrobacter sp. HKB08]
MVAMDGRDGDEEEYETAYETLQNGGEADEQELELADDDESLPWLDSDYDDEEEGGYDTGRLIGMALLGLLLIAAVVGGIWWLGNRTGDDDLVADGSTIEAPEGPVKERPADAGGKQFEGTGNVAPAVGEGESREGRLAAGETPKPEARPSIDAAGSKNTGSTGESAQAPASGGFGVQVGAFSTRERAVQAWGTLNRQTDALSGFNYRVVEGKVDGGTVYRLQAVAGSDSAARQLCNALKADGLACQLKR